MQWIADDKRMNKSNPSILESTFLLLCIPVLAYGWYIKEFEILTAEEGTGYNLGIIGGTMMLILMLYPVRKHAKFMRKLGQVKYWFRAHMVLGILGPIAVLYHANFSFGSINSNVALISMMVVACSGLIGRFIYAKIHHGLYGRKASVENYKRELEKTKSTNQFKQFELMGEKISTAFDSYEASLFYYNGSIRSRTYIFLPFLSPYSYFVRVKLQKQLKEILEHSVAPHHHAESQKKLKKYTIHYLTNINKVVEFEVYDRIFSLWHIVHLPLFLIMCVTGLFHVYAVHSY